MPIEPTEVCGRELDRADPLASFRERFHLLPGTIYVDGNSLGLLSRDAETSLLDTLEQWKTAGIGGWFDGDHPWIDRARAVGASAAPMMGAEPDEVVHTGTTTVNIHALVASLYRPEGRRRRILADELNFPTDLYALEGQILLRGGDPGKDLVLVRSSDGRFLDEERIAEAMTDEIALALFPSVLYRSGQLLDMKRLTRLAHQRGIVIGFDCSHSAGIIRHRLDEWGVDFAVWCAYKYLNSGPGASAFLYVNRRHFGAKPLLRGWFGNRRETMFDLANHFEGSGDAGQWQISAPAVLGGATLVGSLAMIDEAGIERIREKSLGMTSYLIVLADAFLRESPYEFRVTSPRRPDRRGGHVALERCSHARRICEGLLRRGVVPDFRPPDVIRICPSPLYGTYHEIWRVVQALRAVVDETGEPSPD